MIVYPEVAEPLAGWLSDRLGADVAIADLKRHAEGFSWQTYTLTASWEESGAARSQGYAVRREPEDGLLAPYDVEAQYRIHRAVLDHSDVPMPDLFWLETDPGVLGMPFYVMERMEGVVPVQWRGKDPEIFPTDEARREIGLDFVDVLARIHAIDVDAAGLRDLGPETDPEAAVRREIDFWESFYEDNFLLEVPLLRFIAGWLRRNIATSGRIGLVHGDYRIGNFMLGADRRINAVFDWELAHVGDPVEDLGWLCLRAWRFGNDALAVGG
ncbi:MAG TPA: phosphotransferase family protein, partial [Acidimicrobiia bacterium]|nr:phosphotransferase family protein [Acidimicrobiia bacterium]